MKKHISVILTAVLAAVCLSACGQSGKTEDAGTSELSVVATIFPPYDFTRQIAGDDADVIMLLSPERKATPMSRRRRTSKPFSPAIFSSIQEVKVMCGWRIF